MLKLIIFFNPIKKEVDEEMKVIKFGGSSLANATQLKKVFDIVNSDKSRKFVVVSAPGKRTSDDTKVTDLLIAFYHAHLTGINTKEIEQTIIARYQEIIDELEIKGEVLEQISAHIHSLATLPVENNRHLYDTFLAAGEDNNARLVAAYFTSQGLAATYMNPKDAGILVSDEPSNARILPESFEAINYLNELDNVLIIPGFFGYTKEGEICTFSRGGSDITGSIIAAGVKAEIYENFTDVDGIFAAHPGIVHHPHSITELTYREMRELAYAGFTVFHDEALIPAYRAKIPVVIKNTNNPEHPGTRITLEHVSSSQPVVGIASDSGFASINISKYLMNREVGFGRKILSTLEAFGISFEHMPSGIDDISVIIREKYLTPELEELILKRLTAELDPDDIQIEHDLSIIMIVGEGMKQHIGVTAKGTSALSRKNINLELINQGSSEVSVMFGIQTSQVKSALRALYNAYFE
jgi:aspartate kinase